MRQGGREIGSRAGMLTVVIVIHLMVVATMIGVVLLQKSEGGGLGIGSTAGFLSSRGTANVLTRTTAILAMTFFATSLLLSVLASMERKPRSIIEGAPPQQTPIGAPVPSGEPGGLLGKLGGGEQKAPPAPQVPPPQ